MRLAPSFPSRAGFAALSFIALSLCAGSPLLAQQDEPSWFRQCDDHGDDRVTRCSFQTLNLSSRDELAMNGGENGAISVRAWDGNGIVLHVKVQARAESEERAKEILAGVHVLTDNTVRAEGPRNGNGSWNVQYIAYVPRRMNLNVHTHNGPVNVSGVTGRMDLAAVNGPVVLQDVDGDVTARAENGPVSVRLGGNRWSGRGLDARAVNGPVTLEVPESFAAHLEAGAENGPFAVDPALHLSVDREMSHASGDIGGGGAPIRLFAENGPVAIHRSR